jgi:predicted alpha/beta-fold hydrolase
MVFWESGAVRVARSRIALHAEHVGGGIAQELRPGSIEPSGSGWLPAPGFGFNARPYIAARGPCMGQVRESAFRPAWWLPGPHLQTLWPSLTRPRPSLALERERVELADGDFIDLALGPGDGPTVVVIHGLEGDLHSHYAGSTLSALAAAGFRPAFMHLRGCSGELNRLPRAYHSGASDDLAAVLDHLARGPGGTPLAAVGFSLGGNLLLKYLGETPEPLLQAGVAVSVPFLLRDAMLRLNIGFSRRYRDHLMTRLRDAYRRKRAVMPNLADLDLDAMRDFYDFDDQITAPLNGFAGADDYYARCSCRPFLRRITKPTLILHARDDPFMFAHSIPRPDELGPRVELELSRHGGHVGFVGGSRPWRPEYWIERRIVTFLKTL